jgi:putative ABC transport system ATP-binding protein
VTTTAADPFDALVECRDVGRTFGRGNTAVVAVHGATCTVRPGDRVALCGPSGSGKSTLLQLFAGIDQPTTGSIRWPALGEPPHRLAPGIIGFVFQGPSLLPDLDIAENVAVPLLLRGIDDRVARARAVELLGDLDLADLAAKLPDEISGGQAQRAAVARALIGDPRLLLADEPTGQLDRAAADSVVGLLLERAEVLGCTLVVTTHDQLVADRFATTWAMSDGRPTPGS